ncbi:hypothetical protein [Candidatus Nitrotoga sp. 1052]|uniref:hypothetical protein n=1 Tax=Candidatus Nitrotoga sp. 1052 TaxID=2886964 RepID=UPI001EF6B6F6|nr:hypothetical protein [Candidatus Nitrotoga sp. 1052]
MNKGLVPGTVSPSVIVCVRAPISPAQSWRFAEFDDTSPSVSSWPNAKHAYHASEFHHAQGQAGRLPVLGYVKFDGDAVTIVRRAV